MFCSNYKGKSRGEFFFQKSNGLLPTNTPNWIHIWCLGYNGYLWLEMTFFKWEFMFLFFLLLKVTSSESVKHYQRLLWFRKCFCVLSRNIFTKAFNDEYTHSKNEDKLKLQIRGILWFWFMLILALGEQSRRKAFIKQNCHLQWGV